MSYDDEDEIMISAYDDDFDPELGDDDLDLGDEKDDFKFGEEEQETESAY